MNRSQATELIVQREDDGRILLKCPGVGHFTDPAAQGHVLTAGQRAGTLITLGRAPEHLAVPRSLQGAWRIDRVAPQADAADHVFLAVGFDEVLYELTHAAAEGEGGVTEAGGSAQAGASLVLRSPQSGRFYHRPAPGEDAFASEGDSLQVGTPIGLLEIMKTYHRVHYQTQDGLPASAQFVRYLTGDGDDVSEGEALLEVRS